MTAFVFLSVCLSLDIHTYYRQHRGEVVGLAFSPDGDFMYSAGSQGSLALYNSSEEEHSVIRVVCTYTHALTNVHELMLSSNQLHPGVKYTLIPD